MASVQKFRAAGVAQELRHNLRETQHCKCNPDIDPEREQYNDYNLGPDRSCTPYQYYKQRLDELYIYDRSRKDINTAFGWIVTLPAEVTDLETEQRFFETVSDFLLDRYGPENCVSIAVHRDEAGQSHLHYIGIPVVENNMRSPDHPEEEKLCCKEVINRRELQQFHPDLQKYLSDAGLDVQVHSGVTAGQNRTVDDLKRDTIQELQAEVERLKDIERKYNELLEDRSRTKNRWEADDQRERGRFE